MSFLETLWLISGVLAAASVAVLFGVVASRALTNHLTRVDAARREMLVPLLLAKAPAVTGPASPEADRRLVRVAAEMVREASNPAEQERLLDRARDLGVAQRLRADLRAWSARRRSTAATLLAGFPGPDTDAALSAALGDADGTVRLAAALALAHLGHEPALPALIDKLGLGTIEHSHLTTALFDEVAASHPERLRELVAQPGLSPEILRAAIEALAFISDGELASALIGLALDEQADPLELAHYLRKLGDLGDFTAAPVVASGLGHPRPRVRANAAQAAGKLGLVTVVPRLGALLADGDWWVRFRAGGALVELGEPGRDRLRAAATGDRGIARETAVITLAEHGLAR